MGVPFMVMLSLPNWYLAPIAHSASREIFMSISSSTTRENAIPIRLTSIAARASFPSPSVLS